MKTQDPKDNRAVLLMAQDEGRFGRLVRVMKAWCPAGHRPLVAIAGSKRLCLRLCSDCAETGQNDSFGTSLRQYQDDGTVSARGFS